MEVRKKVELWVKRYRKMRNLHGCHCYLKMLFEKIFKEPLDGVHCPHTPPNPQRVKWHVSIMVKINMVAIIFIFRERDQSGRSSEKEQTDKVCTYF